MLTKFFLNKICSFLEWSIYKWKQRKFNNLITFVYRNKIYLFFYRKNSSKYFQIMFFITNRRIYTIKLCSQNQKNSMKKIVENIFTTMSNNNNNIHLPWRVQVLDNKIWSYDFLKYSFMWTDVWKDLHMANKIYDIIQNFLQP